MESKNQPIATLEIIKEQFLPTLTDEKRQQLEPHIRSFVQWFGNDKQLTAESITNIDDYCQRKPPRALEALKAMLAYAYKKKMIPVNLSVHVPARKAVSMDKIAKNKREQQADMVLTKQGHADLTDELARLLSERPVIAEELEKARADRDFRENAPLDAAREHQAQVESRIRELEATLKSAVVMGNANNGAPRITIGHTITMQDLSCGEEFCYTLVNTREADPGKRKISTASPTGSALIGRVQGDIIEVTAPGGLMRYRITLVTQSQGR
jgi:transcription elongation factor GreA